MSDHDDHRGLAALNPRIAAAAREGCAESRRLMSRRAMLGVSAALFSSAFLPNFAKANTDPEARFMVIVLRGGMDGIGMLIPKLDSNYVAMRQQLALDVASTLSLGADFALHPALARVHQMFADGNARFAPAVGLPVRNRSHFECQDNLENGLPANAVNQTGWLNRLLGSLPAGDPIRVARGIEIGEAPLILQGPEPVLGWSPTWFEKSDPGNVARLQAAYTALDPALWSSLSRGLEADALALASGAGGGNNISVLRRGFIGAARLMRAPTGPRIAVLSVGGWDMHSQEGALTGDLNNRLSELDEAIGDLKAELGAVWAKTVAICVTEFGRTVQTNGDAGTDHGVATVAFMVGGAVQSGFIGDWPGIAQNQLFEGNALTPTVDIRSVFKGILRDHIGVPQTVLDTTVFPGSAGLSPMANLIGGPQRLTRSAAGFMRPLTPQDVAPIAAYRQRYGA